MENIENINNKKKRKFQATFPLNELNQDLIERVLSWLPTSSFLQLISSVCKRWKSTAGSNTFKVACSQIPSREPWFYMVDSKPQDQEQQKTILFDTSQKTWIKLHNPHHHNLIPISSSGSLILFRAANGTFVVKNPVSNSTRFINPPFQVTAEPSSSSHIQVQAIAMTSSTSSDNNKQGSTWFKVVLVMSNCEQPNQLMFTQYTSTTNQWSDYTTLVQEPLNKNISYRDDEEEEAVSNTTAHYFLTKGGDVVSTQTHRSPCKQYSSILITKNKKNNNGEDQELLYFINSYGNIVSCNLTREIFTEHPSMLPAGFGPEYSIDLVEYRGEVHVVLLSEFLEHASLRVWKLVEDGGGHDTWRQVAAMPPWMTRGLYGKKVDVNCCAVNELMMVCLASCDDDDDNDDGLMSYSVMCDLDKNEWIELSKYCVGDRDFVCGFAFEPRIEASFC